jgi:endonuclease YncB( thermonuclease family)
LNAIKRVLRLALLAFTCLGGVVTARPSDVLRGRVIGVTDGDTVKVLTVNNETVIVRLFAIDAPETSCHAWNNPQADARCTEAAQPFGKTAKQRLADLVMGRQVTVVPTGAYAQGRLVGTLWRGAVDINLEMLRSGLACHYAKYGRQHQSADEFRNYANSEQEARQRRLGQWADARSRCGWEHRRATT